MLKYESDNGYTGTMEYGNFRGYKHIDLFIRESKTNHLVFHRSYEPNKEIYTMEKLKEEVEGFPELYKLLYR